MILALWPKQGALTFYSVCSTLNAKDLQLHYNIIAVTVCCVVVPQGHTVTLSKRSKDNNIIVDDL